jgi:hypothetical protein
MHAISVDRAGTRVRKVAMPDFIGVLGEADTFDLPLVDGVEQAELDLGRVSGEQGEIDT